MDISNLFDVSYVYDAVDILMKKLLIITNSKILLIPENGIGNIEYKLRLDLKSNFSLKKMVSQMNWRLTEGKDIIGINEAHYILGILDNGNMGNMSWEMIKCSYNLLVSIINNCNGYITAEKIYKNENSYFMYILINKKLTIKINEINAVFVGPSGGSKTTTIGYLTYGKKDDGLGITRNLILKYGHEKISGITTSIKKEIIGIKNNMHINYSSSINSSWEDIVEKSDKIINLIDLPGDKKYYKTTFFGLLSYNIHIIIIVIDCMNIFNSIVEINFYLKLAKLLNISVVFLISKCDKLELLDDYMKLKIMDTIKYYETFPIFKISNITGNGYGDLLEYFNNFKIIHNDITNIKNDICLGTIIETFCIPDIGTVLSCAIIFGYFEINDDIYISDGKNYEKVIIKSIQKKYIDSKILYEGETGGIRIIVNSKEIDFDKYLIITNHKYNTYKNINIEIEKPFNTIYYINQHCSLFISNMISQVIIQTLIYHDTSIILKVQVELLPIIIPKLDYSETCIGILKTENEEINIGSITRYKND